jgi:hypothetical protein
MSTKRSVTVVEELDVPADFLWQTISDFEHIDRWTDLKVRAIEGSGIGCQRTVEMESGALVTECLLVCDPARMVFGYGIVAPNPYPMYDYRSTVTIEKISDQRCRLTWVGDYVPIGGTDPVRTDNLLRKVYSGGIELLRRHFAQQKS